jgi:hypothetical protein
MAEHRFDHLARTLATSTDRRSLLGFLVVALPGGALAARHQGAFATPDKVPICVTKDGGYTPKALPPPAAQAQVNSGKAVYPLMNSDDFCAFPCGPECLACPQRLPSHTCTKCVNGECTCPDSHAVAWSVQGGLGSTTTLLGSSYQAFNYDESTQTIGSIALSGVQTVTDPSGRVSFGPFPGDAPVCLREVATPAGYTVIGHDFACLHLGCGHEFVWDFAHEP